MEMRIVLSSQEWKTITVHRIACSNYSVNFSCDDNDDNGGDGGGGGVVDDGLTLEGQTEILVMFSFSVFFNVKVLS